MRINNNIMAMNTYRQLGAANGATSKAMEKLSSGLRINRAGDDAAGLSISEKMRAQIRGLNQASSNAQDGISLIQTAEGALNETQAILQRMRELLVQAGNGTNNQEDLAAIQDEINALIEEIGGGSSTTTTPASASIAYTGSTETPPSTPTVDASAYTETDDATWTLSYDNDNDQWKIDGEDVSLQSGEIVKEGVVISNLPTLSVDESWEITITAASTSTSSEGQGISDRTQFNGMQLLDGSLNVSFQIGANRGQQVNFTIGNMSAGAGGLDVAGIDVTSFDEPGLDFDSQLGKVDDAIKNVSQERSKLGAMQNRLEHTIKNVDNAAENLQAAESRIRDVDMAKEMMEFTKNSILQQAATAMLAQANQAPQGVLQLLR